MRPVRPSSCKPCGRTSSSNESTSSGRADELEDDRVRPEIGDACAEDLGERHQLGALARRRCDLEQRELALDRLAGRELLHAQHVHELVHLLLDLLERVMLAVDAQRDARDLVPLGRTDGEALDVEAAPREHARDAHERTRLVLDEDRQCVFHDASRNQVSTWLQSFRNDCNLTEVRLPLMLSPEPLRAFP